MDWELAIDRNRTALLSIVVALLASVGGALSSLPRFLYVKTLLAVRQAESATRRLIFMAAHALPVQKNICAKPDASLTYFVRRPLPTETRVPTFNLIDPLKNFEREVPDFDTFEFQNVDSLNIANNAPISIASLKLRLLALKCALESIPKQAKRLARWYGQRDLALSQNQPHRLSPIRPGPPPSSRKRNYSEVGAVLSECHSLAIYARERRNSS